MPGFALDRPRYLDPGADLETVYRMLLEVASELWVTRDRLALLEATLTERGLMSAEELERIAFAPEVAATLEEDRARFVARLAGCVEDDLDGPVDKAADSSGSGDADGGSSR